MTDNDKHGGDSLTDAGWFVIALAAFAAFCGIMVWLVPPLAHYFAGMI
jgi:hypothetical protein